MMPSLLYIVYAIHLAIFGFFWWRRREWVYGILVATFVLLLLSHTLRVYAPQAGIGAVAAYCPPRVAAWITAAMGLAMLVIRRLQRRAVR